MAWNGWRFYGPLASARFDPHEPPPHEQDEGVGYFGADWLVCLAEVFQQTRTIDTRTGTPFMTGYQPARALQLIDLTGEWPITVGASHHINTGRKDHCRAWARAFRHAWPAADGIVSTGVTSGHVVTLFNPAGDAFPAAPLFDRPLSDVALASRLYAAANRIGYTTV